MSNFKRVTLAGSEELFRPTRPRLVDEANEAITEMVDRRPPKERNTKVLHLTPDEIELLLEAIQTAKYPERAARGKLSLDRFERYDQLRNKLQDVRE
jgi:hypothetical protein